MNIVKAYYLLNMKMLIKDKISFIWSIILPSVFIIFNKNGINNVYQMRYYYAYIIFSAYLMGVGLHSLRLKENGSLKVYFSIKESRVEFFIANLLTQITFSFICITFVNIFACILLKLDIYIMFQQSIILIFAAIPSAFLFFNLTLLKNVPFNSINTLVTIFTTICVFLLYVDTWVNFINPLRYISDILVLDNLNQYITYGAISVFCILSGMYSIKRYSVMSSEVR